MRNTSTENVQEHSHTVAVIAHALAVIRRDIFKLEANPEREAVIALFHDASEIFTGDLPTPIKYFDPDIMSAYKRVESVASVKLLAGLPVDLRASYDGLLSDSAGKEASIIVKAADRLAAYVKCLEELKSGNSEFEQAAKQSLKKLKSMDMPEVDYFLEHFIPAYELTLDELNFSMK